jgi:DNA-binding beta-propeller fold protein YncE
VLNRGTTDGIAVYAAGQTTLERYITDPLVQKPVQDFFDAAGNLYFSDMVTGVSMIPAGSSSPVSLGLQGLIEATGIALDPESGDLFVDNYNGESTYQLLAYATGQVDPTRTLAGGKAGYNLTMGRVGKTLYLFDPTFFSEQVYVYKHDSNQLWSILTAGQNAEVVAYKPAGVP